MRIENLKSVKNGNRAKVAATVNWEDSDHPAQELYFETVDDFAKDLSCNPHAFLVACIMPAMHYGEERVFIDEEICPELREGLKTAMSLIRYWYKSDRKLVRIEAKTKSSISNHRLSERTGMFFSGGIDSLAILRANRLNFSLEHPGSIKDALLVYGLEVNKLESFDYVLSSMSEIAREAGITLIPVYTNVRSLEHVDNWSIWEWEFQAAALSSIAHAFSRRLSTVIISSTYDIPHIQPYGSHPLLDPCYSSRDIRIKHDNITLSRFDKMKLVADWTTGFQNIRTCNNHEFYQPGMLNCGKCPKCVSAMLAFMALGVLEKTRAFPIHNISKELLISTMNISHTTICFYDELITPLKENGHYDLARIIEQEIERYQKRQELCNLKDAIRVSLKRFDNKFLNGNLKKLVTSTRNIKILSKRFKQ